MDRGPLASTQTGTEPPPPFRDPDSRTLNKIIESRCSAAKIRNSDEELRLHFSIAFMLLLRDVRGEGARTRPGETVFLDVANGNAGYFRVVKLH